MRSPCRLFCEGKDWSAQHEAIYLIDKAVSELRIAEDVLRQVGPAATEACRERMASVLRRIDSFQSESGS